MNMKIKYIFILLIVYFSVSTLAQAAAGQISNDGPCQVQAGQSQCTVTVTWTTANIPSDAGPCVWFLNPISPWHCEYANSYQLSVSPGTYDISLSYNTPPAWSDPRWSSAQWASLYNSGTVLATTSVTAYPSSNTGSFFNSLSFDQYVDGSNQILNSQTIYLPSSGWVYVQSDGRYYSATMPTGGYATVYIAVDGVQVSNDSSIDWSGSNHASQHSYNAIGAAYLSAGIHNVSLVGSGQQFYVGAGSNLSLLANPSSNVVVSTIQNQAGPYSFSLNSNQLAGTSPLPSSIVLQNNITTTPGTPIFSTASFSEQNVGMPSTGGDAFSTIYHNGNEPTLSQATRTNNDGYQGIELTAPMYSQSYFSATNSDSLSLNASLYPWMVNGTTDPVKYYASATGKLISLYGGMQVYGSSNTIGISESTLNSSNFGSFICIGSNQSYGNCPSMGSAILLTTKDINIPSWHSGEVLFMSKLRMQGDSSDGGGQVVLYITIDGVVKPTIGIQGVTTFDGSSQRTLSTSYLAAGNNRLSSGTHTIQVWVLAQGQFIHMTASSDVPLIYFD